MSVRTLMTVSEKNPIPVAETDSDVVTCPVHPKEEATLRCNRCGRPRAVFKRFKLCRGCFREMAHAGELPGIRKASW